jgi:hypothetical protein
LIENYDFNKNFKEKIINCIIRISYIENNEDICVLLFNVELSYIRSLVYLALSELNVILEPDISNKYAYVFIIVSSNGFTYVSVILPNIKSLPVEPKSLEYRYK